jgi:N-(2-amino-2-carboxyethyl)-L-glutamate synthase
LEEASLVAYVTNTDRPTPLSVIGRTPLVDISLRINFKWRRVGLKLESYNPGGSIKDRTAYALVRSLEAVGKIHPGHRLVESTSGNLGVALALIGIEKGYSVTAVVDPKVDPAVVERMRLLGAEVITVNQRDATGGYLLTRLDVVTGLVEEGFTVWPNQYRNSANPAIHYQQTAPEIRRQKPDLDAIFVAASTGGTLAGVGRYFKAVRPEVRVVGVDVPGSRVFGTAQEPRVLSGIGSSCASQFLRPDDYDDVTIVNDRDAVAACHLVYRHLNIGLGGSAGAALAACARYLAEHSELSRAVCICPDGRSNYMNSIYSEPWLSDRGFCPQQDAELLTFDDMKIS